MIQKNVVVCLLMIVVSHLVGCNARGPSCQENAFALADSYVSCLWDYERASLWASLREKGFRETFASLGPPHGSGVATTGGAGDESYFETPKGRMTFWEYFKFCQGAWEVTTKLRNLAGGRRERPDPGTDVQKSNEPHSGIPGDISKKGQRGHG